MKQIIFCVIMLLSFECVAECSLIKLHYNQRVPYASATENGVEGLTAIPAALAFKNSGIPFQWENTPIKRQMKMIEDNEGCDCLLGRFKTAGREKLAKFTHPIYQDKPQIALARADNDKLQNNVSVDSVLSNQQLKLEVKEGYSYGVVLDEKIARYQPNIDKTTNENILSLKKIHSKRMDYFFIAQEEADGLIESSGIPKNDFKYITFSDITEGEKRYIMCSLKVSDEIITKLNRAIENNLKNKQ
jgi:polar amino acid transport system substrate-binding protein